MNDLDHIKKNAGLNEEMDPEGLQEILSICVNIAHFAKDSNSIMEEFRTNNGDTFKVLAKKLDRAVEKTKGWPPAGI